MPQASELLGQRLAHLPRRLLAADAAHGPRGRPDRPRLLEPGDAPALLVHRDEQRPIVRGVPGHGLQLAHEIGDLLRPGHVAREQHDAPDAELADERLHVGRGRVALEADHEALADAANEVLHPASFFLTASLTRLPSTALPEAASAASAAFIALPMSLGELAPVSATACSTAAAISASVTSAGR